MACKGVCDRYKSKAPPGKKYALGFKRCSKCGIYIKWKGMFCPCCNTRLKTKPSCSKLRQKIAVRRIQ